MPPDNKLPLDPPPPPAERPDNRNDKKAKREQKLKYEREKVKFGGRYGTNDLEGAIEILEEKF